MYVRELCMHWVWVTSYGDGHLNNASAKNDYAFSGWKYHGIHSEPCPVTQRGLERWLNQESLRVGNL